MIAAWFLTGLRREAGRLARKHRRLREHELLILNQKLAEDGQSEEVEILDTAAATNDTSAEAEDAMIVQEALSLLTPTQQKVIVATVLKERTEQEVANEMGVSQQAVNKIKERALNRLKKDLSWTSPPASRASSRTGSYPDPKARRSF